jgi:putative spermidine/putrescine transport system substrate-binding protein
LIGTTGCTGQHAEGGQKPVEGIKPKEGTTGWSDTWMIYSKAEHPNCMYLWMNHMISPEAQVAVAESFGEAPVNLKACELTKNQNHCDEFHAAEESWWDDVYYWTTPTADCGGRRHLQDAGRLGERLDGDPRLSGGLRPRS